MTCLEVLPDIVSELSYTVQIDESDNLIVKGDLD